MTTDPAPVVSVVTITHNHEQFIRDALDSFLVQRTDFPIEVVVADDGSTDATAEIVRQYATTWPGVVKPIFRAANVGIAANLQGALEATRGRYIALCEGDDYWTDPDKLQIQVDFLEAHPDTAVCFHPVRVVHTDHSEPDIDFPAHDWPETTSVIDLLAGNFIQTNSAVYRRLADYAGTVPQDALPLDWYLHVLHARNGEISFIDRTMSVYRRHPGGIWWESSSDVGRLMRRYRGKMGACFVAMKQLVHDRPEALVALRGSTSVLATELLAASTSDDPLWWEVARDYPELAADAFAGSHADRGRLQARITADEISMVKTEARHREHLDQVERSLASVVHTLEGERERVAIGDEKVKRLRQRVRDQQAKLNEKRAVAKRLRQRVRVLRDELDEVQRLSLRGRAATLARLFRLDRGGPS